MIELPEVSWSDIELAIQIKCKKHPNWLEGNLQLAKILFDHIGKSETKAKEWSFGALPVGYGSAVKFWPDFYCVEADHPTVIYADPRRAHGLTSVARKFVFSAMHHHIAHGDFESAHFKIAIFPINEDAESRDIRFFEMKEDEIVDIDTLNSAIQETYQIWFEILEEREREARKSAQTGTGGLFG